MRRMAAHAKLAFDHDRHALRCPDLTTETEGLGAAGQEGRQLCPLFGGQLGSRAWTRTMRKRLDPMSFGAADPLAHCSRADTKSLCNLPLRPPLLSKFPSAKPTAFAPIVRWFCSCWSHTIYDTT